MGKLVLRLPDGNRREFPLARERLTIGRRADNDICLPFPAVSGEHAAVVTILDDSFLEDLGSTNGTLVNGKSITKHFLRDYDEIDIGRHVLVYVSGDYVIPEQTPLPAANETVAVTANGGATIGDDEATVVYSTRSAGQAAESAPAQTSVPDTPPHIEAPVAAPLADASGETHAVLEDASSNAAILEVLDGPSAGVSVPITGEEFIVGRVGAQIASLRSLASGVVLVPLEGDGAPCVNGAVVAAEGALLTPGDEIEIAGTRLAFRVLR